MESLPSPTSNNPWIPLASASSTAPKLRDSCYGCAVSKLRCSKEKPTCARCIKRRLTCQYFATKRAGRKRKPRQQSPSITTGIATATTTSMIEAIDNDVQQQSQASIWSAFFGTSLLPANLYQPLTKQQLPNTSNSSPNLLSTPTDSIPSCHHTPSNNELDEFFNSMMNTSTAEHLAQSDIFPQDIGENSSNSLLQSFLAYDDTFSIINEGASEPESLNTPSTSISSNSQSSPITSDANSFQSFCLDTHSQPDYCCLTKALKLLQQLFPNASTVCIRSGERGSGITTSQLPTIQEVVTENEQTIQAITNILECSCSQDIYLLTVISLIIFKVMAWYAAAARKRTMVDNSLQSNSSKFQQRHFLSQSDEVLKSPAVVRNYHIGGEDQARMASQLILSELYRVQRLVNQLSHRMRGDLISKPTLNSALNGGISSADKNKNSSLPISAMILEQLEVDLRKSLRSLASDIMDTLREG